MAAPASPGLPIGAPRELFRNFATDPRLAAAAKELVIPMIKRARRNRIKIDERGRRRYNQWALLTDEQFYRGRANSYIPAVRKGVERLVTQAVRETFPSDRWWDAQATAPEFEANVPGMKTLMDVQLKRQINLKRKARPYYRQLFIYGTSPLKAFWRVEQDSEPEVVLGPKGPRVIRKKMTTYDGPDVEPIDFFSFFVYPETCQDLSRARLVFEDVVLDYDEIKDDPNYANLKRAKASAGSGTSGSEALIKRQERLRRLGITEDELNDENFLFLTECYGKFDFKDGLGRVPAIITLAWESEVVRLQRNPYGQPPYFVGKDNEMVDEFYGHPRTEATDRLQIILNDAMNQDLDASSFANNPMVVVDPNFCEDYQAIALFPGAKIPAPPDAVKFDRPPEAAYSQKEKIAFLNNLIADNLGSPASASPSPAASGQPRGARTFGGMQLLQAMASSDTKEVVEFQEDLVWEPLLAWIAKLNARFLADERVLRLAGQKGAPVTVNRDTFGGDYAYEWLGTETVQNQTMRSAQMLVFLNITKGQGGPGWRVNMPKLLRTWWEHQGLKGGDEIIIEDQAMTPVPPQLENEIVLVGRAITVAPQDNDPEHIAIHDSLARQLPPGPELERLVGHIRAHQQQFVLKQQMAQAEAAQRAAMAAGETPPYQGPPPIVRVDLKGQLDPRQTQRFAGGPAPNGARAGVKPTGTPSSGMGPARAIAATPVGVP